MLPIHGRFAESRENTAGPKKEYPTKELRSLKGQDSTTKRHPPQSTMINFWAILFVTNVLALTIMLILRRNAKKIIRKKIAKETREKL